MEKLLKIKFLFLLLIFRTFYLKISKNAKKKNNLGNIQRFGSNYGGWYVFENLIDAKSRILSVGAGEDISFDVEVANHFGCHVDIYDPTPRAIEHFRLVEKHFGNKPTESYKKNGNQSVMAYSLEKVLKQKMCFLSKAIWIYSGEIKFFQPQKNENVSHSITPIICKSENDGLYILVECMDILEVSIEKYDILKLDIEGAEINVLERLFEYVEEEKLPSQILVEFDELKKGGIENFNKVVALDNKIKNVGYELIFIENLNFTYCKSEHLLAATP